MIHPSKFADSKYRSTSKMIQGRLLWITVLLFVIGNAVAQTQERKKFDHLGQTGFDLTAVHRLTDCADCHLKSIFSGTPRKCRGCHGSQGIRSASRKGANHIRSTDNCDLCHTDTTANSWLPIRRVDHLEVRGSCFSCHNGVVAPGKNSQHIPSGNRCDDCHLTRTWTIGRFDHAALPASGAGQCFTCHNNVFATGKHNRHLPTSNVCDDCHLTSTWVVARFDHGVLPASGAGQCAQCHGPGKFGTFLKPAASVHIRNSGIDPSNVCDACHLNTSSFLAVRLDHDELGIHGQTPSRAAGCIFCHGNEIPPPPHTSGQTCGQANCHTTSPDFCVPTFPLAVRMLWNPGGCGHP